MAGETHDYVIAGGGSAACVAAMRLVREFGCPRADARARPARDRRA